MQATCFPSMAPMVWGKFHLLIQSSASCLHPASVLGGVICSSIYSSTIASHTSLTTLLMVLWGTLQEYCMSVYLAPDARCLRVRATLRPGSSGFLKFVVFLVILGVNRWTTSSNMVGGILMKFWKDLGSSFLSSTMSLSYMPSSTRLVIQGLTQTDLGFLLFLLLLLSMRLYIWTICSWCSWRKKASTSRL